MEDQDKIEKLNTLIGQNVATKDGKLGVLSRVYTHNKSIYAELTGEPNISCSVSFLSIWQEL